MVALGEYEAVEWALVIACSMARSLVIACIPCRFPGWLLTCRASCVVRYCRWMRRLRLRGRVSGRCESVGIIEEV
jgi:hypothetical protein